MSQSSSSLKSPWSAGEILLCLNKKRHENWSDNRQTPLKHKRQQPVIKQHHTQGPKLTFLGRRQLATEIFWSRHMEKMWSPKSVNKFFLHSETQIHVKLWSPIFLLRIRTKRKRFPNKTNKIKYKHADCFLYILFIQLPLKYHVERIECWPYTQFRATAKCFQSTLISLVPDWKTSALHVIITLTHLSHLLPRTKFTIFIHLSSLMMTLTVPILAVCRTPVTYKLR